MTPDNAAIDALLTDLHSDITRQWLDDVAASSPMGANAANATGEAQGLMNGLRSGLRSGADPARLDQAAWASLRAALETLSQSRAAQGATAGETSHFVLALKKPLFSALQERLGKEPKQLFDAILAVSTLLDHMAQWTVTTYQATREDIIRRQQEELLELSTPVVKLWEGVLAVPMIGTLDSNRTQLVMESLLQRIVETGSEIAIIDITGVPTVDTLVAQHLLKTVTAIRLMGADCIISGIRPQIAQTIVHLGIDLQGIVTKASLADALLLALKKLGYVATRTKA
ncbi:MULTISPECIES: STAS domain-containing protein [unclassified Variovorax]|uniref:STAS domain-containing protein n=1 Tax=unclassified Variovorax TaxID=663243 RepID=UPI001BD4AE01|nr:MULTISPECIES: STAS domain-containing protein [unclassified Variovorax]